MTSVLSIQDLRVKVAKDETPILNGVSFDIQQGETLALVGASGSGKSLTAMAVLGLLPPQLQIASGNILFQGKELCTCTSLEWTSIRGTQIGMIFQDPLTHLNPTMCIGNQIAEMLIFHRHLTYKEACNQTRYWLEEVGIPSDRFHDYPFQLSGGQQQRVMIAMALVCQPTLILADEPTTALDPQTQSQILGLLKKLIKQHNTSLLFITHDLRIANTIADTIAVMDAGMIVEMAAKDQLLNFPKHSKTQTLVAQYRRLQTVKSKKHELPIQNESAIFPVQLKDIGKTYRHKRKEHRVLEKINLTIYPNETIAIVGPSGVGKSTLGRIIAQIEKHSTGHLQFGTYPYLLTKHHKRNLRKKVQMIFQDHTSVLNPLMTIQDIIAEGLDIHGIASGERRTQIVEHLLTAVGLPLLFMNRYPHELSGGQRQRIGIARALALEPECLICDEPFAALDLCTQEQILNLMKELQQQHKLTYLLITHDADVVRAFSDRVIELKSP